MAKSDICYKTTGVDGIDSGGIDVYIFTLIKKRFGGIKEILIWQYCVIDESWMTFKYRYVLLLKLSCTKY